MRNFSFKAILLVATFALVGASCGGSSDGVSTGVYRSSDRGDTWQTASAVLTTSAGQTSLTSGVDILEFVADPQDSKVIYAGTRAHGIWYTINGGAAWTRPRNENLANKRVRSLAINPSNTCILYAAIDNTIQKSTNCGRTWNGIYKKEGKGESSNSAEVINDVVLNPHNVNELYIGTSGGSVLKSIDTGKSWKSVTRLDDPVKEVLVNPKLGSQVVVATAEEGVFRSDDGGNTWEDISPNSKEFRGSDEYSSGVFDATKEKTLFIATKYGLLKSDDAGDNWVAVNLNTAPGEALIFSLAISPKNANHIYYGTLNAFYRSLNGGETWETKKIPTNGAITALLVDKEDTNVVYLGSTFLNRK